MHSGNPIAGSWFDRLLALGTAPAGNHLCHRRWFGNALTCDKCDEFALGTHHSRTGDKACASRQFVDGDTPAVASLHAIFTKRRALGIALAGDSYQLAVGVHHTCGDDLIPLFHFHTADTPGGQPHTAHVFCAETDGLSSGCDQNHLRLFPRLQDPAQFVLLLHPHHIRVCGGYTHKIGQADSFDTAADCDEEKIARGLVGGEPRQGQTGSHIIPAGQIRKFGRMFGHVRGNLVDAHPATAAIGGEDVYLVPGVGSEQGGGRVGPSLAQTAAIDPGESLAANLAVATDRNPDLLVRQQIGRRQGAFRALHNLSAAAIPVLLPNLQHLLADDAENLLRVGQQVL